MVRRTALRQASPDGGAPDERSLTVTTAVVPKGDDVEGVAAKTCPICGVALRGRQISPCSDRCRAAKSRRQQRVTRERALTRIAEAIEEAREALG